MRALTLTPAALAAVGLVSLASGSATASIAITETPINTSSGDQFNATINVAIPPFPEIVYTDNSGGTLDIVALTRLGPVLFEGPGDQQMADISDDFIVFVDDIGGDQDIFKFDLNTGVTTPVVATAGNQHSPTLSGSVRSSRVPGATACSWK